MFEIVGGLFALVLQIDIAISHFAAIGGNGPDEVIHTVDVLQVHGDALKPIGQFAGDRIAFDATGLLKVGKLGHFHAV